MAPRSGTLPQSHFRLKLRAVARSRLGDREASLTLLEVGAEDPSPDRSLGALASDGPPCWQPARTAPVRNLFSMSAMADRTPRRSARPASGTGRTP